MKRTTAIAWRTVSGRIRAGALGAALFLSIASCGGSTTGTGGVTVDGRVLDNAGVGDANVLVTVLETGDSDHTVADGSFHIVTEAASSYVLLFEKPGISARATIANLPADTDEVSATFTVHQDRPAADISNLSVHRHADSSPGSGATAAPTPSQSPGSSDNGGTGGNGGPGGNGNHGGGSGNGGSGGASQQVQISGTITAISGSSITVGGVTFLVNASTDLRDERGKRVSLADFAVGDSVRAHGTGAAPDSVTASRISKQRQ
jgi:hypothetical protein